MKFTKSVLSIFIIIFFASVFSLAQNKEMQSKDMMKKDMSKKEMMNDKMMHKEEVMKIDKNIDGLALKGYDPVSYFTDMKPEMGVYKYKYDWAGATWQFKNEKHLKMFKQDPEKYAPQFGGYCGYGAGKGKLIHGDPNIWTIENGKVYLNVNKDVQKLFRKDLKKNIGKAEKKWPELSK